MMFFNTNLGATRSISFFLAFVLIVNSFLFAVIYNAQPAQAIFGAGDVVFDPAAVAQSIKNFVVDKAKWVWEKAQAAATHAYETVSTAFEAWKKSDSILAKVSYQLMYITVQIMLQRMTQNIVGWLDGGAKGSPKIFQDFGQDFENAADLAGGAVIGGLLGLNNGELCDPNFLKVRLVVGLDELRAPTFQENFKCSFTGGLKNLKAFKDNFEDGGWKSWVQLGRSENNNIGNYLTAQREIQKAQAEQDRILQAKIVSGNGLKPQEVCRVTKDIYVDESGAFSGEEGIDYYTGNTKTAGRLSLGSKLTGIMSNYGYSNLDEFKSFWKMQGGDFTCKTETPASALADLSSKILNAPFDGLNDSLQAAAANLGKDAPAIFRPYLNAITTSAINLLIRKEKGLISGVFDGGRSRSFKRQNSASFKNVSENTLSGKGLLSSATSLRDLLLQSILDFNLFSGTLTRLVEKKGILLERPILVSELLHSGLLWKEGFKGGTRDIWLPNSKYPENPTKDTTLLQDQLIANRTKDVIDKKAAGGFPTLPSAGTMNLVGNSCGAFTQELKSQNTKIISPEISRHIGYVALQQVLQTADNTLVASIGDIYNGDLAQYTYTKGRNGWFTLANGNKVRIIAFNDAGLFEEDETTGKITPIPDRFVRENFTAKEVVTFIDTGYGINQITVGQKPANEPPNSPIIYSSELVDVLSQDYRVFSMNASTGDPNNSQGSIYYIKGSKDPTAQAQPPSYGSAVNLGSDNDALYNPLDSWGNAHNQNTCGANDSGPKVDYWRGDNSSSCTPTNKGDVSCKRDVFCGSDGDVDRIGIPAYINTFPYNIKYFSPILEGATATIENQRREIAYDDLLDANGDPITLQNGADKYEINNLNPFKMRVIDFFPEVTELQNEFMTKIRTLLGYTQGEKKSNLSSLADQIGAIPDDDGSYLSVSDALTKYNDLADLYQELFIGVSSEETLEGLDPKYEILTPTETNIKLALIGKRCPTVPPSATSTPELIKGCGDFNPTQFYTAADQAAGIIPLGLSVGDPVPGSGEYNMAKKFVFTEDNETGFTTNPFTGSRSSVLAGILNIDEMTQQLTTLPPDSNIIKLLRIRQLLEQLQVTPKDLTIPDKISTTTPEALSGVDLVQVSLRNYPKIEEFLNTTTSTNIGTATNPIIVPTFRDEKTGLVTPYATAEKLVHLYGFTSAKEAYPQISTDLDNVLPEIATQIQDKLKDVFLKRVELELEKARIIAQKRLLDFIYFANDLSPAIQIQVPQNFVSFTDGVKMQMNNEMETVVVRIVSSELGINTPMDMNPTTNDNCMSLSGDKINKLVGSASCMDSAEFKLRGFKVLPWNYFKDSPVMVIDGTRTINDFDEVLKAAFIRKALMSGIRKKIEQFNKMLGVNVNSIEFKNSLERYVLPKNDKGEADIPDWDKRIEEGLHDVNVLFTGIYSDETGHPNKPGRFLTPTSNKIQGKEIHTDIQTRMTFLSNNFSLLQREFDKIKDDFTSSGSSVISAYKNDMEDINKLFDTMEKNYKNALGCVDSSVRGAGNNSLLTFALVGGGTLTGVAVLGVIGGPIGMLAGFVLGGFFNRRAKRKARRKARRAADRCAGYATEFNKSLIELSNKFICGGY